MQKLSTTNFDNLSHSEMDSESVYNVSSLIHNDKSAVSLASSIGAFRANPFGVLILDCDFPDRKAMDIAVKLAMAIDRNSVNDIKYLKSKYGSEKEFCAAKEYLDRKAKDVWDVFHDRNTKIPVPREAMKSLGITNIPSLDFMLGDSLKLFESDGSSPTVAIIRSILANKNLNYTFEDIYNYLLSAQKKYCCEYNIKTVAYLIECTNCDVKKLETLGVDSDTITKALQGFSFWTRVKYLFNGGLKLSMFPL